MSTPSVLTAPTILVRVEVEFVIVRFVTLLSFCGALPPSGYPAVPTSRVMHY